MLSCNLSYMNSEVRNYHHSKYISSPDFQEERIGFEMRLAALCFRIFSQFFYSILIDSWNYLSLNLILYDVENIRFHGVLFLMWSVFLCDSSASVSKIFTASIFKTKRLPVAFFLFKC